MADWSDEELQDAVEAYLRMFEMAREGRPFVKSRIYQELASRHGRQPGAFERRMMNISAVLESAGFEWLPGLAPNRNVGSNVAPRIQRALEAAGAYQRANGPRVLRSNLLDGWPMPHATTQPQNAVSRVRARPLERETAAAMPPPGTRTPREIAPTARAFLRDEAVKAWVLARARGVCECCKKPAPFIDSFGAPFLEVHHLRQLAAGGSDTVTNAVAVCPNCHRALHHGREANALRESIYTSIADLVRE